MKRYSFSQHEGVNLIKPFYPNVDFDFGDTKTEDEVMKLVYALDPLTGRPRSDLGTYMSENCNPLVRDYIERQLRCEAPASVKLPDGLTDSDISLLTRDVHEDMSSYVKRVNSYMMRQKMVYQKSMKKEEVLPKTE